MATPNQRIVNGSLSGDTYTYEVRETGSNDLKASGSFPVPEANIIAGIASKVATDHNQPPAAPEAIGDGFFAYYGP